VKAAPDVVGAAEIDGQGWRPNRRGCWATARPSQALRSVTSQPKLSASRPIGALSGRTVDVDSYHPRAGIRHRIDDGFTDPDPAPVISAKRPSSKPVTI
jgi:hypothetical protein